MFAVFGLICKVNANGWLLCGSDLISGWCVTFSARG